MFSGLSAQRNSPKSVTIFAILTIFEKIAKNRKIRRTQLKRKRTQVHHKKIAKIATPFGDLSSLARQCSAIFAIFRNFSKNR